MVGLLLHRMLPAWAARPEGARALRVNVAAGGAQALGMAMLVWRVARALGSPSAIIPTTGPVAPSLPAGAVVATFGLGVVGLGAWWWRRAVGEAREGDDAGAVSAGLGALSLFAAGVVALVARDLTAVRSTPPAAERLIHLFVYNYDRVWPGAYLDFRPVLAGFGAVAVGSLALLAVPAVRGYAVRGVLVAATLFAAWSLDVYMVQLTPHWSQRPLMEAYYARRRPRPASLPDRRFTHTVVLDLLRGELRDTTSPGEEKGALAEWDTFSRPEPKSLPDPVPCADPSSVLPALTFLLPARIGDEAVSLLVDMGAQRTDLFATSPAGKSSRRAPRPGSRSSWPRERSRRRSSARPPSPWGT